MTATCPVCANWDIGWNGTTLYCRACMAEWADECPECTHPMSQHHIDGADKLYCYGKFCDCGEK